MHFGQRGAHHFEHPQHQMQTTMLLNPGTQLLNETTAHSQQLMLEKMDLQTQLEDLREKLAIEFNKKRRLKAESEEKIATLTEEMRYYKDVKCGEMSELLRGCQAQLREFEDLNSKSKAVIERLEGENRALKDQMA